MKISFKYDIYFFKSIQLKSDYTKSEKYILQKALQ